MTDTMLHYALSKTDEVAFLYQKHELNNPGEIERFPAIEKRERTRLEITSHVRYLCNAAMEFLKNGKAEKAHRWLGFAQGALWAMSACSIDELKEINMPKNEDFIPS